VASAARSDHCAQSHRTAATLTEVEGTLQQLILEYGSQIKGPVSLDAARTAPQCRYLLTDQRRMAALEKLLAKARGRDFVALVRGPSLLQGLKTKGEELLLDAALVLVKRLLANVPRMRVWNDKTKSAAHLPAFSCSPLPYVTQIAEHLFLLPDQLDPSHNEDRDSTLSPMTPLEGDDTGSAAAAFMENWLSKITGRVVTLYFNTILAIPALSPSGQIQLSTDMQYLSSILDRLGAPGLQNLQQLQVLVEAHANDFPQAAANSQLERDVIDSMSRQRTR